MNVIKRIFGSDEDPEDSHAEPTLDYHPFPIQFSSGRAAIAIHVPPLFDAERVARLLKLPVPSPTIFISGGAGDMSDEDKEMTRRIIDEGLVAFAQEQQIIVIDGGTQTGVMQLSGDSRCRRDATFPLVGIAPLGVVEFPGHPNPEKLADLNDGHSHFVLIEGREFGEESRMILQLTNTLCGGGEKPAMGIIINGGKVVEQEALMATSKELNLPLLVLQGSGRFADQLAEAKTTGRTDVSTVRMILKYGNIKLVSTREGPDGMRAKLKERFGV
jgi:hypothetical protein